jgi:hypothetical protein
MARLWILGMFSISLIFLLLNYFSHIVGDSSGSVSRRTLFILNPATIEEIRPKMSDINSEEFDLSALILHNSTTAPFFNSPSGSPVPEQEQQPQIEQRPISKRRGKKRSSRACTTCRQRKVRCNIIAHGAPCSNCRHDEIDCILPLSRRQR